MENPSGRTIRQTYDATGGLTTLVEGQPRRHVIVYTSRGYKELQTLSADLPAGVSLDSGDQVGSGTATDTPAENEACGTIAMEWQIAGVTCEKLEPIKRVRQPSVPVIQRTLEFRLQDVEEHKEFLDLPADLPARIVVAASGVRAYVTRGSDLQVADREIGGIEVEVELVDDSVCCTVRVRDFRKCELVVVQVDVAIHEGR